MIGTGDLRKGRIWLLKLVLAPVVSSEVPSRQEWQRCTSDVGKHYEDLQFQIQNGGRFRHLFPQPPTCQPNFPKAAGSQIAMAHMPWLPSTFLLSDASAYPQERSHQSFPENLPNRSSRMWQVGVVQPDAMNRLNLWLWSNASRAAFHPCSTPTKS